MNTNKLVEEILNEFPETKSNDKMLCYKVYERIAKQNGETIWIPFNLFKLFPAFETISRIRRKLNEEKEIKEASIGIISTKPMGSNSYPSVMY